jgi:Ni/Co efflux regulator RcnB
VLWNYRIILALIISHVEFPQSLFVKAQRHQSLRTQKGFEMLTAKTMIAALMSLVGASSVSAAGTASSVTHLQMAPAGITQVQGREDGQRNRGRADDPYRGRHTPDFRPGRRYDRAPPNWRRYQYRPRDWRTRGCVIVGPIWFCP